LPDNSCRFEFTHLAVKADLFQNLCTIVAVWRFRPPCAMGCRRQPGTNSWPFLDDVRFPATPLSSPNATKDLTRIVWHYFTIDWLATLAIIGALLFTDWVEAPRQVLLFNAVRWFFYFLVYPVMGRFQWRKMKANTEWINVILISLCFWLASRWL